MYYHKYIYNKFKIFNNYGFNIQTIQCGTEFSLSLKKNNKEIAIDFYLKESLEYGFDVCFVIDYLTYLDVFKTDILFDDYYLINNITFCNLKEEIDIKFNFMINRINNILDKF